jgi:hypothetical protein
MDFGRPFQANIFDTDFSECLIVEDGRERPMDLSPNRFTHCHVGLADKIVGGCEPGEVRYGLQVPDHGAGFHDIEVRQGTQLGRTSTTGGSPFRL